MELIDLIRDRNAGIDRVGALLNELSHPQRIDALAALGRDEQRRLYAKASEAPPVTLEHFVPADRGDLQAVRHHGKNTLPLPRKHRFFAKVFCRPRDGSPRLFGFNDSPSKPLIGPGYFVAVPTEGHARWHTRGPVVIDYFQVPDGEVPSNWPKVVRNTKGLQRFVYEGTRDYMRSVSDHVTIGAAFKGPTPLDHYFVLCREP